MNLPVQPALPEVIVVGGGPAGVATAVALARAGKQVTIYEARSFKQPQLADLGTGEVLSPGAQLELARLGFPCENDAGWRLEDFAVLRQFWTASRTTRQPLPAGLKFWQIDRRLFDRALLDFAADAGVTIKLGCRVKAPVVNPANKAVVGVRLSTPTEQEVCAPLVVDASGRHSPLLTRLGLKQPESEFQRFAVLCFFSQVPEAVSGEWEQHFLGETSTTLNGSRMSEGLYRYTIETDMQHRAQFSSLHSPLELFLALLQAARPELAARFRLATPLPYATAFSPIGYRVAHPTQVGLVLVGDATGYLDPASGQGIEFALRTARLAAKAILHHSPELVETPARVTVGYELYQASLRRDLQGDKRDLRLYLRLTRQKFLLEMFSRSRFLRAMAVRRMVTPRHQNK